MKIIYYFDSKRPKKDKNIVGEIYGNEITYVNQKPWSIIDKFEDGDILICNSVDELVEVDSSEDDPDTIIKEYMNIFDHGVELVFDKSTQCNSLFIKTLTSDVQDFESVLKKCVLNYFGQRKLERMYSKKHVATAKANGNKVGIKKGTKLTTKKSVYMKDKIRQYSHEFEGNMADNELIKTLGIARNTYYKYKKQLKMEVKDENADFGSK